MFSKKATKIDEIFTEWSVQSISVACPWLMLNKQGCRNQGADGNFTT
jgi:hypothetical protein